MDLDEQDILEAVEAKGWAIDDIAGPFIPDAVGLRLCTF